MKRILVFLTLLACLPVSAQTIHTVRDINWHQPQNSAGPNMVSTGFDIQKPLLYFGTALYRDTEPELPVYNELILPPDYYPGTIIEFTGQRFKELDQNEIASLDDPDRLGNEIIVVQNMVIARGQPALQVSFVPLRRNPVTGTPEKLTSFSYSFSKSDEVVATEQSSLKSSYATGSVLSSGRWVMIKTTVDGIYRLTYNDLVQMGIEVPGNVRIYGNGNRMLPKMNHQPRTDDLIENKIFVSNSPGSTFGQGDYILFYGQGPVSWEYSESSGMIEHERHLYSDGSYYFITSSPAGKSRITQKENLSGAPDALVTEFDDHYFHEEELINLLKSGREWFGEHFKVITSYDFSFYFPNIVNSSQAKLKWRAAARSPVGTTFSVMHNSRPVDQMNFPSVNPGSVVTDYATVREGVAGFDITDDQAVISVHFTQNTASSEGWLDYLLLNVRRSLIMSDNQMHFRDMESAGQGRTAEFRLEGAGTAVRVWDVTDPANISELVTEISGNTLTFADETGSLNQYIAFNGINYLEPEVIGPVPNQNLHGLSGADMIIVTSPAFMNQAVQLANHRQGNDGLEVIVVTPGEIYNEFSSGKPDVTAIRDFLRMLYIRAASETEMPRYLLLFGKGSYDNRPGDPSGINFVPTYQSPNSLRPTQSFVSDDFFGLLDEDEGEFQGLLDIGIGRLPVTTPDQAQSVINKITGYNNAEKKGDWQNILTFIGDDGDNNIHMRDADILAEGVKESFPVYNLDKIYLDAWPKTGTSLGQRYPGVNQAVSERIRKGSLIINYTGHGNELRLADENIIDINDVLSWTNRDRLPVFMTATCEFSRFDNPERVSAGEMLLLNPNGGGIALFSTTRLVYATPNFFLNQNFYRFVLENNDNGRDMRLGDVMRLTKINSGAGINKRNFTLLGDPSMKLAIPGHRVIITSINDTPVQEIPDTLKALGKVSISGLVVDTGGNTLNDFNGLVHHTVYDKKLFNTTLGNDGATPFSYSSRSNVIYKGKASVTSGAFNFSFIVPKDIAYHYGSGKVSSFASDGSSDAAGYFNEIVIGGSDPDAISDSKGPEIELFMNDPNFISGGTTDENPRLLVFLTDSSGINTVGSGIGHDITLVINNDPSKLLVINDYYVADADSYQRGTIEYPFSDLEEGSYNLKLKAWDVFNNSSETGIDFTVARSEKLALKNVFNYPNPFTQSTSFHFEHNKPESGLDVLIQIFTVSGRLVKTIDKSVFTTGFKPDPIPWDGLDDYGDRIGRGVYIYRIRIRTAGGQAAEKYEKLVILK